MSDGRLPEHVRLNRAWWARQAISYVDPGRRSWAAEEPHWGIWGVPESELNVLPDVAGLDAIELGCGTAYVSSWLARRGARVVGVDVTPAQLTTARQFQTQFGIDFPLVLANAERVPFPDGSFDLAISEYGASIWADPYQWVPEAARLLRPGGRLVFMVGGTIMMLCSPDGEEDPVAEALVRDYFGLHRIDWPGTPPSVEFHLGYGDWIRLLRTSGFEVEDLVEVRAPESATTRYPWVTPEWARRWPSEEIWKARKRA